MAFDGVDDRIDFGPTLLGDIVGANRDFTLAFWYKSADPGAAIKYFFRRAGSFAEAHVRNYVRYNRMYWSLGWGDGYIDLPSATGVLNDQ